MSHRPVRAVKGQPAGADLAVEVVSQGEENRQRDYVEKRREYAEAGIAECWIVDPEDRKVTVLTLDGGQYREHDVSDAGGSASSVLLAGFQVAVNDVFAICDQADAEGSCPVKTQD